MQGNTQASSQGNSGGGGSSIIGLDEHNHHNFSLMNNRHNARHHNARRHFTGSPLMRDFDFFLDSASRSSCEQIDQQIDGINHNQMNTNSRQNYRYSPETTDYDSNCGDLDSEYRCPLYCFFFIYIPSCKCVLKISKIFICRYWLNDSSRMYLIRTSTYLSLLCF